MKAIKILIKAIVVIAAIVIIALLLLPFWFGPVVKTVANSAVPGIVKTDFHLGQLSLNPYTARFEMGDMQLSNPTGYSEKYAATLGGIVFDADTLSLMSDTIHIEEITVKDVFVSLVKGGVNNVDNFKQIQYNVAGGKEKYEAAEAEKAKTAEAEQVKLEAEQKAAAEEQKAEAAKAEEKPAKKVVIDKLHISGLKVQYGILPISVPVTIELTDIGKDSGGATLEEAWQAIWGGILKSAGVVGDQLKALGNLTGDAAKQATAALGNAAEGAAKAAGQATEAVGNVAGQAAEGAGKAASAVGDAAVDATKAAGAAVGDAAAVATKAAGAAVDAATEGATKALDSLKKLW